MSVVAPSDFIDIANELLVDDSEIKLRTAACRGYYGAYHAAKKFHEQLPSSGVAPAGVGVHEELILRLENPSLQRSDDRFFRSKSIGMMLRRIRQVRKHADYELDQPLTKDRAVEALEESKVVVEKSEMS